MVVANNVGSFASYVLFFFLGIYALERGKVLLFIAFICISNLAFCRFVVYQTTEKVMSEIKSLLVQYHNNTSTTTEDKKPCMMHEESGPNGA